MEKLNELTKQIQQPICFTIKAVGMYQTICGFIIQAYKAYKKRH